MAINYNLIIQLQDNILKVTYEIIERSMEIQKKEDGIEVNANLIFDGNEKVQLIIMTINNKKKL